MLKDSVFSLIFYLGGLSTDASEVLKPPTVIVVLSISPFKSFNISFLYLGVTLFGCIYIYNWYILLDWSFYHYVLLFLSCYTLGYKVYFVWYKYCHPSFLFISICIGYLFTSFHFQSVFLDLKWVSLGSICMVLALYLFSQSMCFI